MMPARSASIAISMTAWLVSMAAMASACGSDPTAPPDFVDSEGGQRDTGAKPGDGAAGDAAATDGGPTSCDKSTVQASDDPVCDKCAKAKCCAEVQACEQSADCRALSDCIAKCASSDTLCVLTCSTLHDKGSGLAEDLGSCAATQCASECQPADSGGDGGLNFDF